MFYDRQDAGKKLATKLKNYISKDVVILAIPRGGVVVADIVASNLKAPLDLIIPRKVGAPGNQELAIGATAGEGQTILNEELIKSLNVDNEYLQDRIKKENEEIKRRRQKYLKNKEPILIENKVVIVIDDGLATGATAQAAIMSVKSQKPKKVILAVPVAPKETAIKLSSNADEVIVLDIPENFYAVGQFYTVFNQTNDDEVIKVMESHQ